LFPPPPTNNTDLGLVCPAGVTDATAPVLATPTAGEQTDTDV
jgi:hypothetical protein